jgi:hypothetical protein
MREEKTTIKHNGWGDRLVCAANWVVRLTGSAIMLVLVWYAMRFTQYMIPMQGYEYPVDTRDSEVQNLAAVLLFTAILAAGFWLERRIGEKYKSWLQRAVVILAMLWQSVWGFLWITAADRCPKGDQESVFKCAAAFLKGDYHSLGKRGYCEIYPHQLGLASLEELLFRILGRADYYAIQLIFVLMIAGSVYCVYGMLRELTQHTAVIVLGTLLAGSCMAPVFYTAWVYGEVPYVFFALLAAWMLSRYEKRGSTGALIGFVAAVTFAMLVRKNALILVIAFCLVAAVTAISKRDKRLVITMAGAVLIPMLCYSGIYKMYELRSGYEHNQGLPSNGFVYIGLQETEGRCGWDYLDSNHVFYENGRDTNRTREAVSEMLEERLQEMLREPGYLAAFLKSKVLSQWNAPLYQSMYFNYVHEDVHYESVTAFFDRLSTDLFDTLLWGADRLQFVIYFGMLCYFALGVRQRSSLLQHMLAVTVIGGFLFSIVWEAKTRYIFPYYMMMFPLAVMGYQHLVCDIKNLVIYMKKRYNRGV